MILHLDKIDYDPARVVKGYPVGGFIYVSIDDASFPEENWYDMVSVDFENWLPRLISFSSGHTDTCILTFMDGPYQIQLLRQDRGTVSAQCIRDHKVLIFKESVDFDVFIASVVRCVRQYERVLHENRQPSQYGNLLAMLKEAVRSRELR